MWSLVKLKNQTKAIFASDLLKKGKKKMQVNVGGLDITCSVIKIADDVVSLQAGLVTSPEIFKRASVLLHKDDRIGRDDSLIDTTEILAKEGKPSQNEFNYSQRASTSTTEKDEEDKSPWKSAISFISPKRSSFDSDFELLSPINSSLNDSDYRPEDTTVSNDFNEVTLHETEESPAKIKIINLEEPILLPIANDSTGTNKKYFCQFCKRKISKYARHLESVHSQEPEVQNFLKYEKNTADRRYRIALLRNNASIICNSNSEYHRGTLQVQRQQSAGLTKTSESLQVCIDCNGFYSIKSIKNHVCKFKIINNKKSFRSRTRENKTLRRQKFLHCKDGDKLSDRMRLDILPTLRETELSKLIMSDELILQYGEYKCRKLPSEHNNNYIKAQMLYAAKLLTAAKKINKNITSMQSLLYPEQYSTIVSAIKEVAGWKHDKFEHPNVATNLTTIICQLADRYEISIIKSPDTVIKRHMLPLVKQFQSLIAKEFSADINKTAMQNYTKNKADKFEKQVDKRDVEKLYNYVMKKSENYARQIKNLENRNEFCYDDWLNLMETVLLGVITFNKRRVGEAQRIKIEDFRKARKITNDHPSFHKLSNIEKKQAQLYARFVIVGKLYNAVPVLLNDHLLECFDLIINNRQKAGVRETNPYVFGLPSNNPRSNKTADACKLFRKYAPLVGAKNPELLRGTYVRKRLATQILEDGESNCRVESAAKFMGHKPAIHRGVYQQREVEDVVRISTTLEKSIGKQHIDQLNTSQDSEPSCSYMTTRSGKRVSLESVTRSGEETSRNCDSILNTDESIEEESFEKLDVFQETKKIKRPRWTEKEKRVTCSKFYGAILQKKGPSNAAIREFQEEMVSFKSKTLQAIRVFIARVINDPGNFKEYFPN